VDGNSKQVLTIPGSDVRQPSWGPFMDWALGIRLFVIKMVLCMRLSA
jgi:hypothetical protein